MKKQIMSIVAAAAILTTGAMAFDAKSDGTIVTENGGKLVTSSYINGVVSIEELKRPMTQRGDALIYPAFNQKTGWGTEIIVRNTSANAVVAKAVIYAGDDSREVIDFNIYLSAKDVCRFTIKDGKVTSNDGSIKTYGILPHQVDLKNKTLTDYRLIEFADERALDVPMTVETGYVAIYGMEESKSYNGFHESNIDHEDLYAAYAASLDKARSSNWRALTDTTGAMVNGMFVKDVTYSPNVGPSDTVTVVTPADGNLSVDFTDVEPVLTGHVRIYTEGRDVLLPATALKNFTADNRVLWTEGEYASLADRRISGGKYDATETLKDARRAFPATTAIYTYANASDSNGTDNSLLITQPYKRILAQLDEAIDGGYSVGKSDATSTKVATGKTYAFTVALDAFDEDENGYNAAPDEIGGDIITSPRTSDNSVVTPESFSAELQEIKPSDLEKSEGFEGTFANKDGFVEVELPVAAIVTQMTASKAGTSDEINWVYSDKTK